MSYYVLKIKGYHGVYTNLPGNFIHGRDEVITKQPVALVAAHTMALRLNNPNSTVRQIRQQGRPA